MLSGISNLYAPESTFQASESEEKGATTMSVFPAGELDATGNGPAKREGLAAASRASGQCLFRRTTQEGATPAVTARRSVYEAARCQLRGLAASRRYSKTFNGRGVTQTKDCA
jgi:hypothetical protein